MVLLKWALILFVVAIVAAILGFSGVAEGVADIAKVLLFIFLAGVVVLVILGVFLYKAVT